MTPGVDLRFHHFGLATRDAGETTSMLRGLGYRLDEPIFDPLQNVNLIWCDHGSMPPIEVVYPADGPGPLESYLAEFPVLIYHVCYVADDIEAAVAQLKAAGVRVLLVAPPKPAVLFQGRKVGFYMAKGFGLIEILEAE